VEHSYYYFSVSLNGKKGTQGAVGGKP
jgi:hypothetical protein